MTPGNMQAPPLRETAPVAGEPGIEPDAPAVLRTWWRVGVAAAVAGQSMVFSLAVNLTPPDGLAYWLVHAVLAAGAVAVGALLLPPLAGEAARSLRGGRVTVEILFLVTLLGAFTASVTATLTGVGAVYYEVVSILLAIYAAGKTLGARSRAKALRAVEETRERFDRVELLDGRPVDAAGVRAGEMVRVRPGGAIAIDGVVRRGRSFVQETAMTGEWRPIPRGPGDRVLAGTHAVDGELELEVTAGGGQRRLDEVLAAVAAARLAPSGLQRQADRLTAWFLPVVLAVSGATFLGWTLHDGWVVGLFNSMAVLLVACPCALGLATPLAVWQGLARLAEFGVVARTGDVLDVLARADHVCFDKTGTLSEDRVAVAAWHFEAEFAAEADWVRQAVAAVERDLPHPVARALAGATGGRVARDVRVVAGCGVTGAVEEREVRVGAPAWLGADADDGRAVMVAVDGRRAARIELRESWREGAAEVFGELRELGVTGEVLTGDAAWAAAGWPGVEVRRGLTPGDKLARIEELRRDGRTVVFVGDGLNDAAAMSAAATAIAMSGGAALARAACPAVYLGGDLRFLPEAIRVARRVRRSVRANQGFAAAYNAVGMVVAAAGWLHPVGAALLMLGSSAFVSVRALRTR